MEEMTLTLNNPLTEEEWDLIEDVDFDKTNSIEFHTKHGKTVKFVKCTDERTEDMISRQTAIAEFSCCELTPDGGIDANYAIDFLKQLPSAQPEQRWIPCSERLPEKGGDYLTTLTDKDGNYVDVTEWQSIIGGRWIAPLDECDYCEIGNVVAWMPLPEPWRGEEHV